PAIQRTTDLVQEVATSSREQSMGVEQISKAMANVDQTTQRNASASEELASTAEQMAAQAEALRQTVSFFRSMASGGSGAGTHGVHREHKSAAGGAAGPSTGLAHGANAVPSAAFAAARGTDGIDSEFTKF